MFDRVKFDRSQIGNERGTTAVAPLPNSVPVSPAMSASTMAAARATERIFSFCEIPVTPDPKAFLAAVVVVLAQYPAAVMDEVADPARGLPSRIKRPGLVDIRAACEAAYAPVARRVARSRVLLPAPEFKHDDRVASGMAALAAELRGRLADVPSEHPPVTEAAE